MFVLFAVPVSGEAMHLGGYLERKHVRPLAGVGQLAQSECEGRRCWPT